MTAAQNVARKAFSPDLGQLRQCARSAMADGFLQVENVVEVSPPTPKPFSFAKEDWPDWIAHFERYRRATKLDTSDARVQTSSLLLHMGPRSTRILEEMQQPEEAFISYEQLVRAIEAYFQSRTNVVFERARFNLRAQKEGEPVETYIAAVCRLAKGCNYGELEAELVRDRLVVGIRDKKCSEALQMEENLTLEKAKAIIIHAENIKRVKHANAAKGRGNGCTNGSDACGRCGKRPSHPLGSCPARDAKCTKCAKKGHFAKCCQTSQKVIDKCKEKEKQKEAEATATTTGDKEKRGATQKEESFEFI